MGPDPTSAAVRPVRVAWSARPIEALGRAAETMGGAARGEMAADAYLHPNPLLRGFFQLRLRMLVALINRLAARHEIVLGEVADLGGGVGLMCALLAPYARSIRLIDVDCRAARLVLAELGAGNVTFEEGDALARGGTDWADVVIAADVLEHFRELGPIVGAVHSWLRPGGILLPRCPPRISGIARSG